MIFPYNTVLTEEQKRRVLEKVEDRGFACAKCGSKDFEVGEALWMGFLFLDEAHWAHMVALACRDPGCENPRSGIRLKGYEFLWDEQ